MRYDLDCVTYLIRTPMRGRPVNPPRIQVCLCDSRWPRSLAFTLFWTKRRDVLTNLIGGRWIGTNERALYFLEGWDVFLRRLPPTREAQLHHPKGGTDVLQVHIDGLVFTIYHGLGTRDTLWEYTEGGWKEDE